MHICFCKSLLDWMHNKTITVQCECRCVQLYLLMVYPKVVYKQSICPLRLPTASDMRCWAAARRKTELIRYFTYWTLLRSLYRKVWFCLFFIWAAVPTLKPWTYPAIITSLLTHNFRFMVCWTFADEKYLVAGLTGGWNLLSDCKTSY